MPCRRPQIMMRNKGGSQNRAFKTLILLDLQSMLSPPMRGRGLKPIKIDIKDAANNVASHAGAWIETLITLTSRVRYIVASHAGAWIETTDENLIAAPPGRLPCGGVD